MTDYVYMHVMEGRVAEYIPEERRICIGMRKIKRLAHSIAQVRREQRHSAKFYGEGNVKSYSHVRIVRSAFKATGDQP